MAFQTVMSANVVVGKKRNTESTILALPGPIAILGVAGIYDIRLLRDKHRDVSAYQDFIEAAFGPEEAGLWDAASPACVKGDNGVERCWEGGRLAVLARSSDDELVDASQGEAMGVTLTRWAQNVALGEGVPKRFLTLSLQGNHDDAWKNGDELTRAIAFTLDELQKMERGSQSS